MQTCIHYIVHQVFPILELNAQLLVYTVNVQNKKKKMHATNLKIKILDLIYEDTSQSSVCTQ